jgi:ADP-ribose pyrophosphatase YjhB (NUDIX family)
MAKLSVQIAIIHHDEILLIKREDFQVWGMPGGSIDSGESAAQAAVREAKEETGFDVRLTRMIGLYVIPQYADTFASDHTVLFTAQVMGGKLVSETSETLDARFFPKNALPDDLMWHHQIRVEDAFADKQGTVRVQNIVENILTQSYLDLYRLRDESELTPAEFFRQKVMPPGIETTELEG